MSPAKHRPLWHPANPHQDLVTMQEVGQACSPQVNRSLMVQQVVLESSYRPFKVSKFSFYHH